LASVALALADALQNLMRDQIAEPILAIGQAQLDADLVENLRHQLNRLCIVRAAMEQPVWHGADSTARHRNGFRQILHGPIAAPQRGKIGHCRKI
jgi:hypothetical protein